jgi:hypothetical protein
MPFWSEETRPKAARKKVIGKVEIAKGGIFRMEEMTGNFR